MFCFSGKNGIDGTNGTRLIKIYDSYKNDGYKGENGTWGTAGENGPKIDLEISSSSPNYILIKGKIYNESKSDDELETTSIVDNIIDSNDTFISLTQNNRIKENLDKIIKQSNNNNNNK